MANETPSTYMNLPIPGVGTTDGPKYALDINSSLTIIDAHDHTTGYGTQIPSAGIALDNGLAFNNTDATTVRSTRFSIQSAPLAGALDLACIYASGVDLYYNDANGNQIPITANGAVAGSPGSIANLVTPASASYVSASSTFVWQSDASTPANMDGGSVILRNLTANSKGLTLAPPNAMAADYTLNLPALPSSQKFMTLDNSGNITAAAVVDNTSLQFSANVLSIKASGVSTAKIADGAVTPAKLSALGQQVSSSCGAWTATSSFTNVTNLAVTITTTGRPVAMQMISDGSGGESWITCAPNSASPTILRILRSPSSSPGTFTEISRQDITAGSNVAIVIPVSSFSHIDTPSANTYIYTVQGASGSGLENAVLRAKFIAYQL